jgi:endo-1,4-beta-xylanase
LERSLRFISFFKPLLTGFVTHPFSMDHSAFAHANPRLRFSFLLWVILGTVSYSLLATSTCAETPLIKAPATARFLSAGLEYAEHAHLAASPESTMADVVTVHTLPPLPWQVQLAWPITAPVAAGDVLEIRFDTRCLEADTENGEGQLNLGFQRNSPPWTSLVDWSSLPESLSISRAGQSVHLAVRATAAAAADEAHLVINFGLRRQTVRIENLAFINHHQTRPLTDFASAHPGYEGRALDAPWRAAAAARIERIRKGDLTVTVVDAAGVPVPATAVHIAMQRHAFPFGTVINNRAFLAPESTPYRDKIERYFNRAVFEGAMKWRPWESGGTVRADTEHIVAWLLARDITVRGHTLIWPTWQASEWKVLPDDLRPLVEQNDTAAVRARIRERITGADSVMRHFAGKLVDWDVLNEATTNKVLQNCFGEAEMAEWFRLARATDQTAKLYVNDYAMLSGGAVDNRRIDEYHRIIARLIADGAPLDGIGEQAHFGYTLVGMERALSILDRFATFERPLQITEFDVALSDEQVQAEFTRDFITLCFSHPAIEGFLFWGFWENAHWMPSAALWRADWSIKPNGQAFLDLVFRDWWTDVTLTTDAAGQVSARGFLGNYTVAVSRLGLPVQTLPVTITREPKTIRLVLP